MARLHACSLRSDIPRKGNGTDGWKNGGMGQEDNVSESIMPPSPPVMPPPDETERPKRPSEIIPIAVMLFAHGAIPLLLTVLIIIIGPRDDLASKLWYLLGAITGVALIGVGVGVLMLARWAFYAAWLLLLGAMICCFHEMMTSQCIMYFEVKALQYVFGIMVIFYGIFFFILSRRNVKAAFGIRKW